MNSKINHEKSIYECKLFTVKNVDLTLPNGKTRNYELIDIQDAVTLLPIDDAKNVYFVDQFRIGARKTLLELPAGKVEKGEDPLLTARRELQEEIGMDATEIRPLGRFYMTPGYATELMYGYLVTGLFTSPLTPDADEFLNVHKIPLTDVLTMVEEGKIEDSKSLAVLMLARKHLGI